MLGLLGERQAHGWYLVGALRPGGSIGRVWSCTRPAVYRAVDVLSDRGFVRRKRTEESTVGPARTLLVLTPKGRRAFDGWLEKPVLHLREARSDLMLKLLFHDRLGRDPGPLIDRQREAFAGLAASLAEQLEHAEGFDRTIALWRHTNARSVLTFLERALEQSGVA